jgi:isocitrate dehydrogenase
LPAVQDGRVFLFDYETAGNPNTDSGNTRTELEGKERIVCLDAATGKLLENRKGPSPKTGELDNRGSQFYLAMYWAQELAAQTENEELQARFASLAKTLADNEQKIMAELTAVQGKPADIGGYYMPDMQKMTAVMRPSATFNAALESFKA